MTELTGLAPVRLSPRLPRPSAVDVFIGVVATLAIAVATIDITYIGSPPAPLRVPWWALAVMFFGTTSYVANFPFGRQTHSFQLCDVPRMLGLFFATPLGLIVGRVAGALPALVVVRRQPARKVVFNLANFGLEVSVA